MDAVGANRATFAFNNGKNMKTLQSIAVCLVAVTGALAGCGSSVNPNGRDSGRTDGAVFDVPNQPSDVPPGGPCIGPMGQVIPRGSMVTVGPCNATCACSADGQLTCQPGECPPPPPNGCRAPDGSVIPVGGQWTSNDRCQSCVCPAPGLPQCVASPECPPPPPPPQCGGPGGMTCQPGQLCCAATGRCYAEGCLACCMPQPGDCNMVPAAARDANFVVSMGQPPNATGGVITNGLYQMITAVYYTRPGGPPPPAVNIRAAAQITGANWELISSSMGQAQTRANFTAEYRGSNLVLNPTCGAGGGRTTATFTSRPNGFDMIINDPSAAIMYQFMR